MKNKIVDSIFSFILRLMIFLALAVIITILFMFYDIIPNPFVEEIEKISSNINDGIKDIIIKENEDTENTNEEEVGLTEAPIISSDNENQQPIVSTGGQYAIDYYYNQLDEDARIIYNKLLVNKDKFLSGKDTITIGTMFSKELETEEGTNKIVDSVKDALKAFYYDKQEMFYIDMAKMEVYMIGKSQGGKVINNLELRLASSQISYWKDGITSKEQALEQSTQFINRTKEIIEEVKDKSDYVKVKHVHDWLINNVEYDGSAPNCHNAYGAIIEGRAVCEGYARAFKYMMDQLNINTIFAAGNATDNDGKTGPHAWNYVKMDDGQWYAIDVTWDDPVINGDGILPEKYKYKYFLKGESFKQNHFDEEFFISSGKHIIMPTIAEDNY